MSEELKYFLIRGKIYSFSECCAFIPNSKLWEYNKVSYTWLLFRGDSLSLNFYVMLSVVHDGSQEVETHSSSHCQVHWRACICPHTSHSLSCYNIVNNVSQLLLRQNVASISLLPKNFTLVIACLPSLCSINFSLFSASISTWTYCSSDMLKESKKKKKPPLVAL